ncbi:MAG: SUMF1/EgtB/PvdO family nonheme iron enzyme [Proteobacteria bacterium]|nr:SUMF1/EgtB/PvdO family nonheme iron enzyme [Pseudomonadota bacterium]
MSEQGQTGDERTIRLASIVAIDIVGFSTMSERDQRNAARKVEALRARIEDTARANSGRLFNTAGDGFMLEFASAGSALGAIQDILDRRARGEPPIRVGAHVGDVVVTATNDLLGHGVNIAARLQALAAPGTALVSAEFRSMARSSPTAAFQAKGRQPLENIEQRVQTFEILSKRQRFVRNSRRVGGWAMALAVIGVIAYFSPAAYRFYQDSMTRNEQAQSQVRAPAPPAASHEAPQQGTSLASVTVPQPPAPATFSPGQSLHDCQNCPDLVVVPGGLFMMGSPSTQAGRGRDEGPQREVSISPFAIGKYEVTFQQWDACLAGGGCGGYSPPDHGWGRGSHPVSGVSYSDAKAYLDWLNAQNPSAHYRLATEAEWEYAARAGATGAYAFQGRLTTHLATFLMQRTTEVGAHGANAYGLFDMYGNVGEWVEDCYAPSYNLAPVDGAAVETAHCARRAYRGGSYSDQASALRATARRSAAPTARLPGVGFRIARSLN